MVYKDPWPNGEYYGDFRPTKVEEPEVEEGEFRDVGEEEKTGFWDKIKKPFSKGKEKVGDWWLGEGWEERKRLEDEKKRAEEFEELKRRKIPETEERAKLEYAKMREREWKSRFPKQRVKKALGTAGDIAKIVHKVATLGGPTRIINKELYSAPGLRKLTSPTSLGALREATSPGGAELRQLTSPGAAGMGLRQLTTPGSIGQLRQLTTPMGAPVGIGRPNVRGLEVTFSRLRGTRGLSPIEQLVLNEASATPGPDVKADLINKLISLGVPRVDASRAIESLLKKGVLMDERGFKV